MPKINVLPKSIADLIAAGEVVERPASVIKELLENAIDAGATTVTAEIKNGGISYMRVTDNGCGIAREDIRNAFVSHATSKISEQKDLDSIMTLGFRGEALASIAAVAKVEIMTRPASEELGTRYVIEAGEEMQPDDAGCPAGTTLTVRDLFYSTPARMKFLKKDVSEANAVAGVIDRIALSHPEVSFRFIREGKQTLLTSGSGDLLTTAREVFGREFAEGLIPASGESDGIAVSGFISVPHASRPNRNMQFFFINGRLVKTGTGSAALTEAYKNSVMVGKFPSCILNLRISPYAVDVNVHPAKTEVRFSNEKAVFNAVYFACKNALAGDISRVQYKHNAPKDFYAPVPQKAEQFTLTDKVDFWQHIKAEDLTADKAEPKAPAAVTDPASPSGQQTQRPEAATVGVSVKPVISVTPADFAVPVSPLAVPAPKASAVGGVSVFHAAAPVGMAPSEEERPSLIPHKPFAAPAAAEPEPAGEEAVNLPPVSPGDTENAGAPVSDGKTEGDARLVTEPDTAESNAVRVIGEAFNTYLLAELNGKLLVIDKHAAHERMIYEELKAGNGERSAQLLFAPVPVTLTKEEYSALLANGDIMRKAGFEVGDFGDGVVLVSEVPMELNSDEIGDVIAELAGRFVEKSRDVTFDKLDHIFHSVACRSAIKAGDFTSPAERERFVKKLLSMPQIRYCPHGRPVLIEMTQRELEKNFGRV